MCRPPISKIPFWAAGALAFISCAHGIELGPLNDNEGPTGSAGLSGQAGNAPGQSGAGGAGVVGTGFSAGGASASGGAVGSSGAGGNSGGGGGQVGGAGGLDPDGSAGSGGTSGAAGAAGAVMDAAVEAPPTCPTCALNAQYQCFQNGDMINLLELGLDVVNTSAMPIARNRITLRYWYTVDATGAQQPTCVSAALGCAAVSLAVRQVTPPRVNADSYLEVGFVGTAMLAPSAAIGEIRISILGTGLYDQRNDYSFKSTGAVYAEALNVTAYLGGTLAWGNEPP
jgi:hypothetical protein